MTTERWVRWEDGRTRFGQVPEWVIMEGKSGGVRLFAMMALLADYATRTLDGHPLAELAGYLGVNASTIKRQLDDLEALGAVLVDRRVDARGNDTNRYVLAWDRPLDGAELDPPVASAQRDPLHQRNDPGGISATPTTSPDDVIRTDVRSADELTELHRTTTHALGDWADITGAVATKRWFDRNRGPAADFVTALGRRPTRDELHTMHEAGVRYPSGWAQGFTAVASSATRGDLNGEFVAPLFDADGTCIAVPGHQRPEDLPDEWPSGGAHVAFRLVPTVGWIPCRLDEADAVPFTSTGLGDRLAEDLAKVNA